MSILLFLGSVVLLYFTARRLFDQKLAVLACGLVLVCDAMWQYSLSGLPQMLLLFLVQRHRLRAGARGRSKKQRRSLGSGSRLSASALDCLL